MLTATIVFLFVGQATKEMKIIVPLRFIYHLFGYYHTLPYSPWLKQPLITV